MELAILILCALSLLALIVLVILVLQLRSADRYEDILDKLSDQRRELNDAVHSALHGYGQLMDNGQQSFARQQSENQRSFQQGMELRLDAFEKANLKAGKYRNGLLADFSAYTKERMKIEMKYYLLYSMKNKILSPFHVYNVMTTVIRMVGENLVHGRKNLPESHLIVEHGRIYLRFRDLEDDFKFILAKIPLTGGIFKRIFRKSARRRHRFHKQFRSVCYCIL